MLTFKSLTINGVDPGRKMLTFVLTFKSLVINSVDLVDLYMRIYTFPPGPVLTADTHVPSFSEGDDCSLHRVFTII